LNHGRFLRIETELPNQGVLVRGHGRWAVVDAADVHQHKLEEMKLLGTGRRLRGLAVAAATDQE
jgi:hypothetical protein